MSETILAREANPIEGELTRLVEHVLARTSLYCVRVDLRGGRGAHIVDTFIDGDEGVTINECARVSRELALLIDAEGILDQGYRLNVSSPGIDRPLEVPRQYRRHIGRTFSIKMLEEEQEVEIEGRLIEADDATATLEVNGETLVVSIDEIEQAKVVLPW